MPDKEGPSPVSFMTCDGCKWLHKVPQIDYRYCDHPTKGGRTPALAEGLVSVGALSEACVHGDPPKMPEWCPVVHVVTDCTIRDMSLNADGTVTPTLTITPPME